MQQRRYVPPAPAGDTDHPNAWLPALQATVAIERADPPETLDPDGFTSAGADAIIRQLKLD